MIDGAFLKSFKDHSLAVGTRRTMVTAADDVDLVLGEAGGPKIGCNEIPDS